jgi:ubiquinone/menaquinone biosynthesis C-methylase UbiE
MQIDIVNGTAEHLDVADNSVDVVVTTLVLCSVRDPEAALGEIVRVLKPGGRFIFIEHVAASRGTLTHWTQWAVGPAWKVVADGCRPTRETWRVIEQAGFGHVALEHFRLPWPIVGPHIAGVATK